MSDFDVVTGPSIPVPPPEESGPDAGGEERPAAARPADIRRELERVS